MVTDPTIRVLKTVEAIKKTANKFTQKKTLKITIINRVKSNVQNVIR